MERLARRINRGLDTIASNPNVDCLRHAGLVEFDDSGVGSITSCQGGSNAFGNCIRMPESRAVAGGMNIDLLAGIQVRVPGQSLQASDKLVEVSRTKRA
jgi:hypothetical protein